jgi:hypothetical integral membrane protein (TIGR02206 family)
MTHFLATHDFEEFRTGSVTHVLVFVVLGVISFALIWGRRLAELRGEIFSRRLDRGFALLLVTVWCALNARQVLPGHFRWDKSLPLHICDLVGLAAPIALWTSRRAARAILYFWGLGLSTQAFITPMLYLGPAHLDFWCYWICHITIVTAAFYDLVARGYRPNWRDWEIVAVVSVGYVLMVLPLDIRLGVNYGFIGPTDFAQAAAIRALGQWPGRVVKIVMVVWAGTALMLLPFLRRPKGGVEITGVQINPARGYGSIKPAARSLPLAA